MPPSPIFAIRRYLSLITSPHVGAMIVRSEPAIFADYTRRACLVPRAVDPSREASRVWTAWTLCARLDRAATRARSPVRMEQTTLDGRGTRDSGARDKK